jgi:hypothetical protein
MKMKTYKGSILNLTTLIKLNGAETRFIGGDEQVQDFENVNKHELLIAQRGSM